MAMAPLFDAAVTSGNVLFQKMTVKVVEKMETLKKLVLEDERT